jgi:hypothetical protein
MSIVAFWVVTPDSLVGGYQRFRETCHYNYKAGSETLFPKIGNNLQTTQCYSSEHKRHFHSREEIGSHKMLLK